MNAIKDNADKVYTDTNHLSGLAKNIANGMIKVKGYYTYTNAETGERCYIGN